MARILSQTKPHRLSQPISRMSLFMFGSKNNFPERKIFCCIGIDEWKSQNELEGGLAIITAAFELGILAPGLVSVDFSAVENIAQDPAYIVNITFLFL